MGVRPPNRKGIPALAGYLGLSSTWYGAHRKNINCRTRDFPKPNRLIGRLPKTLWPTWVLTSGETEVRGMQVFPPGETPGAWKVGVSPGETGVAWKTGVPRTK